MKTKKEEDAGLASRQRDVTLDDFRDEEYIRLSMQSARRQMPPPPFVRQNPQKIASMLVQTHAEAPAMVAHRLHEYQEYMRYLDHGAQLTTRKTAQDVVEAHKSQQRVSPGRSQRQKPRQAIQTRQDDNFSDNETSSGEDSALERRFEEMYKVTFSRAAAQQMSDGSGKMQGKKQNMNQSSRQSEADQVKDFDLQYQGRDVKTSGALRFLSKTQTAGGYKEKLARRRELLKRQEEALKELQSPTRFSKQSPSRELPRVDLEFSSPATELHRLEQSCGKERAETGKSQPAPSQFAPGGVPLNPRIQIKTSSAAQSRFKEQKPQAKIPSESTPSQLNRRSISEPELFGNAVQPPVLQKLESTPLANHYPAQQDMSIIGQSLQSQQSLQSIATVQHISLEPQAGSLVVSYQQPAGLDSDRPVVALEQPNDTVSESFLLTPSHQQGSLTRPGLEFSATDRMRQTLKQTVIQMLSQAPKADQQALKKTVLEAVLGESEERAPSARRKSAPGINPSKYANQFIQAKQKAPHLTVCEYVNNIITQAQRQRQQEANLLKEQEREGELAQLAYQEYVRQRLRAQ